MTSRDRSTRTRRAAPSRPRRPKPPKPSRAIWWSVAAFVLCLALLFGMFWGMFRVRQVNVVGDKLPVSSIVGTSAVTGENIFTVRSDEVVNRLSGIHEIVVRRVETAFPDRVTIYASMRQPMVVWQTPSGRYALDSEGNVIRRVTTTNLPIVTGAGGRSGRLDPGIVEAVRYAVVTLPPVPNGTISMFRVVPGTGLTIVGRGGWSAVIGSGSPQALVNRIASLSALLIKIKDRPQRLLLVDLRFRLPYLRFAGA